MDDLTNYEIIKPFKPFKGKLSIYFIESHLNSEDKSIEISIDPNDSSIENLIKVDEDKLNYENNIYIINIYKFSFKPSLIDRKKIKYDKQNKRIEIKIILTSNKCIFESINEINIEKDNFLGMIKFSEYKWYLGMKYQPPNQALISDLQIMNYFINALILKENKIKSDFCFSELINYGINLLKQYDHYDYESFILIYINTFHNESGNLIQQALDIFDIDKTKINNNLSILNYLEELENIYRNQYYHLGKINIKEEKYLIRFYTVYIYFLSTLKQKEKLLDFLYDLLDNNKIDELILAKLYLSNFFPFYKTLLIPDDIKIKLENKFIKASNCVNDLLNSFCLISEFTNKNFIKILLSVYNNYDRINNICYVEKKNILINNYYYQNNSDKSELSIIKDCLDLILTMKKKYIYEPIKIDIITYIYFIYNNYDKEFLYFLEEKLFDFFIIFEDLENALLFSSQLKGKQFILLSEIIKNNIEKIINICKKSNKYIDIERYIEKNKNGDLMKIKELIIFIVQKEKDICYKFIKFNINIWIPYTKTNNLEELLTLRKIIFICKEIEYELDEDNIRLGDIIHNLGLELIKIGELKGDKLTEFLAQDTAFYTDKKIKNLENENNQVKMKINDIYNQIGNIKYDLGNIKSDVKSLFISNQNLINKIDSMEYNISNLKNDVFSLKNHLAQ